MFHRFASYFSQILPHYSPVIVDMDLQREKNISSPKLPGNNGSVKKQQNKMSHIMYSVTHSSTTPQFNTQFANTATIQDRIKSSRSALNVTESSKTLSSTAASSVDPEPDKVLWSHGELRVRQMTVEDLQSVLLDWANSEEWNPGVYEALVLHSLDPSGYLLLEKRNDDGDFVPVTSIAAVKILPPYLASIGLYITFPPEERGKGYGTTLWNFALEKLKSEYIECIVLHAVEEQVSNYETSGFRCFLENSLTQRYLIKPNAKWIVDENRSVTISEECDLDDIINYQKSGLPAQRRDFLELWLAMPKTAIRVAYDSQHHVIGYGIISRTTDGYKIAPLFANDVDTANRLCSSLCQCVEQHDHIHIDIPQGTLSEQFFRANKHNLTSTFGVISMFKNPQDKEVLPEPRPQNLMALMSMEVG